MLCPDWDTTSTLMKTGNSDDTRKASQLTVSVLMLRIEQTELRTFID